MSPAPQRRRWRDPALEHLGRRIAAGLIDGVPGDADGHLGWRGALQQAANVSRNDSWVLRIADEIYAASEDITTAAAVRAYAASTALIIRGGAGRFVLDGMLDHAESPLAGARR